MVFSKKCGCQVLTLAGSICRGSVQERDLQSLGQSRVLCLFAFPVQGASGTCDIPKATPSAMPMNGAWEAERSPC